MSDGTDAKRQKTYGTDASACPQCKKISQICGTPTVLWETEHFLVVHKRPPCGVIGHLQMLSKRHYQGYGTMTDEEAAAVGPAMKRCCTALEKVTKCDRVYTAALGSAKSGSHFHAHMIALYVDGGDPAAAGTPPANVTGTPFDVFLAEKRAADGIDGAAADEAKCKEISEAFKAEMAAAPAAGDCGETS